MLSITFEVLFEHIDLSDISNFLWWIGPKFKLIQIKVEGPRSLVSKSKKSNHLQTNALCIELDIQDYRVYQMENVIFESNCRPPCNCLCEELFQTRQQSRNKYRAYLPIHYKVIIRKNRIHKFSPSPQVRL